jgi:hypothetical protein
MEIKLQVIRNFFDTKHGVRRRKKQIFIETDEKRAKELIDSKEKVVKLLGITKDEAPAPAPDFNADKANGKQLEDFAKENNIDLTGANLVKEKREIIKQWIANS